MKLIATQSLAVCAALALPLLALPAAGHAADAPAPAGVARECSQAFAASLGTHLRGDHYAPSRLSDPFSIYTPADQLRLTARDPANQRVIAEAICTYDSSGQVLRLSPDPLDLANLPAA